MYFKAVDIDRSKNKTLEDAGFHNANIATSDNTELLKDQNSTSATTEIFALCKAFSTQTATH